MRRNRKQRCYLSRYLAIIKGRHCTNINIIASVCYATVFFFTFLYNNWFRLYLSNVFGDSIPDRILIIKDPYTILDSVYYCQRILHNCAISIGRIGLDLVLLLLRAFLVYKLRFWMRSIYVNMESFHEVSLFDLFIWYSKLRSFIYSV